MQYFNLFTVIEKWWQVGFAFTLFLGVFTFSSLIWVMSYHAELGTSPDTVTFLQKIALIFYLIPLLTTGVTFLFGKKTFKEFLKQNDDLFWIILLCIQALIQYSVLIVFIIKTDSWINLTQP